MSLWQQLTHSLLKRLDRFRGPGGWLMALTAGVALWLWNWPLMLATLVGLLSLPLAYQLQQQRQPLWWQKLWSRSNRQLTLSVAAGGLATLSTYMAAIVWQTIENHWLAIGTIAQGLATLAIALLLLHQRTQWGSAAGSGEEMQMLSRLSTADPLDRLIAIRQVTAWAKTATPTLQAQTADCFRLMLQQEGDVILQTALLDGLQALATHQLGTGQLGTGEAPIAIPIAMQVEAKEAAM